MGELFNSKHLAKSGVTLGDKTTWHNSPEAASIAASRQLPSAEEILGPAPFEPAQRCTGKPAKS
jgi:hypothetical protein